VALPELVPVVVLQAEPVGLVLDLPVLRSDLGLELAVAEAPWGWCLIESELVLELELPVLESMLKAEGLSEWCSGPLVVLGVVLAAPGLET
jgi:hypothetical protein